MEMYQEAYHHYMMKCETYGIEGIDFNQFINSMTEEQIQMMISELN